jgi:hypothetical protein
MMKYILILILACTASCTSSDVDNTRQTTTDTNSRNSIDSSAIFNEDSKLPSDTMKTTLNH